MVKNNISNFDILSKLHEQEKQLKRELSQTFLTYLDSLTPCKRLRQMESLLYDSHHRHVPTLDRRLTPQEKKCLYLASKGKEIKEMARILGLSQRTIKFHRANIVKKLDVPNLMAAIGLKINLEETFTKRQVLNILYTMPNNVYWLDRNCILRGGNNELAQKLNLKSGLDLEGLTYEQMAHAAKLPAKEFEPYRTTELEVMETGVPSIAKEEPPIISQGKTFYYLSSKLPLRNKTGEIIGIVGISTDITSIKEIQFALQVALEREKTANKEKIEFFINIAHDLKELLDLLKAKTQEKRQNQQELLQIIHGATEKLSDFLNSVKN